MNSYAKGYATSASFLQAGKMSLEVECLRNGTLDVDLETGEVWSVRGERRTKRKLELDEDGYLQFWLNREKPHKRGKSERDRGKLRYRRRRVVRVHRLVKIKAIAVAKGGDQNWRKYVCDLPRGVDVNHYDGQRTNNRAGNLELQTEKANRARREMTDEEYEALLAQEEAF